MGVCEDTVHLIGGEKRLEDDYKDPNMLPKVNKTNLAEKIKIIKENLRSHHSVTREPLAYIIRKAIIVQTYGSYPKYATPDDEIIDVTSSPRQEQTTS